MYAKFGPGGNPEAFYDAGYKGSIDMPEWLLEQQLTAYEYQCSRGANVKEETARLVGQKAAVAKVALSIHAPYYISLATEEMTTAANTRQHFTKTLRVAQWMGADRIVFHIGGAGKRDRFAAMEQAKRAFSLVLEEMERLSFTGIYLCPETMGKQNQLGTLEEVLTLCKMSPWVIPAVDFGHLHAVTGGLYTTEEEVERVFDRIGEVLGADTAKELHIHFSRIEFTKAGERRHWTFDDPFGPPHEPLLAVCARRGFTPRIICESAGTQAADAKSMQEYYYHLLEKK